jgi:membrane-associated phospholipid phosphatase
MLLLFGVLSVSLVWTAGQKIDAAVFHFFNRPGWKYPWLDNVMRLLTELGNSVVTVLVAVYLFFGINRSVAYSFILGSLILWLIVESVKAVLRRARPFSRLENVRVVGTKARGKSFPSGHTCQAFFTAAVLLNFIDGGFISYAIVYALAVLVGVTRMYMGMHYPRDVLGGAILGTVWGLVGITVNSYFF